MTKLNDVFADGETLKTKVTRVRVDETVETDKRAEVYYKVDLSGTTVKDAIDNNYNVTFAGALRKSFESQEELLAFAEKYATKENPYQVHVNDLGKKILTPEQRKAQAKRDLLAIKTSNPELYKQIVSEIG